MSMGSVTLVGAGPGMPDLLTLGGLQAIRQAEAVVYDRLVGPEVLKLIPAGADRYDVGKTAGHHPVPQEEISALLVRLALRGLNTVRLKGGDPFLFGRGGEEVEALLEAGVPFRVLPGVSSALAVPALAGIPVTHRNLSAGVHILTGHRRAGLEEEPDYAALVRSKDTLVFLMGIAALPRICAGLLAAGMDPAAPACVVEEGSTPRQRRYDGSLASLPAAAAGAKSPAIIVVGPVCALAPDMDWYDRLPLRGCRVLVTRPEGRPDTLERLLREKGAEVLPFACSRTLPLDTASRLKELLAAPCRFQTLVLTSPFGADCLWQSLLTAGLDARALAGLQLAAIGPSTAAALRQHGLAADLVPAVYDSAHLADLITAGPVLLARSDQGSPLLPGRLRERGLACEELALYRLEQVPAPAPLPEDGLLWAMFTSSSGVKALLEACPDLDRSRLRAVCIGPVTLKTAREAGLEAVAAEEAALPAMVRTLEAYYTKTDEIYR